MSSFIFKINYETKQTGGANPVQGQNIVINENNYKMVFGIQPSQARQEYLSKIFSMLDDNFNNHVNAFWIAKSLAFQAQENRFKYKTIERVQSWLDKFNRNKIRDDNGNIIDLSLHPVGGDRSIQDQINENKVKFVLFLYKLQNYFDSNSRILNGDKEKPEGDKKEPKDDEEEPEGEVEGKQEEQEDDVPYDFSGEIHNPLVVTRQYNNTINDLKNVITNSPGIPGMTNIFDFPKRDPV